MAKKSEGFLRMELKGVVRNTHENYPIRFDYSEKSGIAFLVGCTLVAKKKVGDEKTIERRMNFRAFGDNAEQLAHIQDGDYIHIAGEYEMQKNEKDGKWYPIVTVDKVIDA